MPFQNNAGGDSDDSDEVISCDGDTTPGKDALGVGDDSKECNQNGHGDVEVPAATQRRGRFSAMLNSGKPITWHGLQNKPVESKQSLASSEAAYSAVDFETSTSLDAGSTESLPRQPEVAAKGALGGVTGVSPLTGSNPQNSAGPTMFSKQINQANTKKHERIGKSDDIGKSKLVEIGPLSQKIKTASRQSNQVQHAAPPRSRASNLATGTPQQSKGGSVPSKMGRCKECSTTGPGQMGPAGTEYEKSFYCNACWTSWGLPKGSANAEKLADVSEESTAAGIPLAERRCKECLRRGPGQMGPPGTEYADSFYCHECWSSWGFDADVLDVEEEYASPSELEVAALLAWCSPGYRLGTLQSVDADIAKGEFKRFARAVGGVGPARTIAEELLRLAKTRIPTLKMELKKLGFPSVKADDAVLEKRVLLTRLKEVLTWLELSEADLYKVCSEKQLPNVSTSTPRAEKIKLLADNAWKDRGIPVDMFENQNRDVAFGILEKLEILEKKSRRELITFLKGKVAGTCLEGVELSKSALVNISREILLWGNLSTKEVVELCLERGVAVTGVDIQEALESSSTVSESDKNKMFHKLLHKLGSDLLKAQWASVARITARDDKEALLQEFRRIEDLSFEDLRQEYQNLGLPLEPGMDAKQICEEIKTILSWNMLPSEELRKEIAKWTQSFDCSGKDSNELIQQLMVESAAARYVALGIPVYRIEHMHGMVQVVREWELLERMTDVMLAREWKRKKFPHNPEEIMPDSVKKCLRSAAVWAQFSPNQLMNECNERGMSLPSSLLSLREEERKSKLMERLVESECSGAYCQSRGIPVEKIASIESAMQLLLLYQQFEKMSNDELMVEYKKFLPVDEQLQDQFLLQRIKDIHLWAVLPLSALKEECQKRGLRCRLPEERRAAVSVSRNMLHVARMDEEVRNCQFLRDRLLITFCEPFFRAKGIPAVELGSVEVCNRVSDKFDEFANMSAEALSKAHLATGLPRPNNAKTNDFLRDLQQYAIWSEAPLADLRRMAHEFGILATVDGRVTDDSAREDLIRRLVSGKQQRRYESHGIPVRRLDSTKSASILLEVFEMLENMSNEELVRECAKRGFPEPPAQMERLDKLKRMKWAISIQELPFVELRKECVSSGVKGYHSAKEDRRTEMLQKLLAMVWDGGQSKGYRVPFQPQARGPGGQFSKHFQTLGLLTTANMDDVKKAYKKLALKYHPDKQEEQEQDAGARFLEIHTAYETLCDYLSVAKAS